MLNTIFTLNQPIWQPLAGITVLLLAAWELYSGYTEFQRIHKHGNRATSGFSAFAIYYSIGIGLILLGAAYSIFTMKF